jgi:carboxyl-terminal processing protease
VPSGRCIQRPEKQDKIRPEDMTAAHHADSVTTDSMDVTEKEVFYTNSGRLVYGGGGVLPDLDIDGEETYKPIEIALERNAIFFDYAVNYVAEHPETDRNVVITDDIYKDFRSFSEGKEFEYKTSLEYSLDDLKEVIEEESKDSLYQSALDNFEQLIELEKSGDFDKSKDYIYRALKREIVSKIDGQRGIYEEIILKTDQGILQAIDLLLNTEEYSRVLTQGHDKDQVMVEEKK